MADRVVSYTFRGSFGNLNAGLATAGRNTAELGAKLTALDAQGAKMRQGLTTLGSAAGKMGLVAAAGLGLSVKAAIDWETAWTGVTKTVNATATTSLGKLEGQLRSLASELPSSHAEIAAVAEAAGQLGVKADDVADFTRTMIDLGQTTNLSAEEAATSIARFSNIMGTATSEVDRIGSTLVDLGNNSETTEAEILTLGQRLAAAGSIAGLSEADVLGFASTLTSVGVEAEAGGTALSKVFTSVRDATLDGGEKLETFAKTAGISTAEFKRAFEEDAAGAIEQFISGLGRINESGASTTEVFNTLGLTDQRLMRALLSTAQAGDTLSESLDRGGVAWQENSALAEEAEKRYGTSAAKAKIAINNIRDAAIDFGAVVLPAFAKGAEAVGGFAKAIQGLPGPVKGVGTSLLGITAVLGGGLWFTSKVINGIASAKTALGQLGLTANGTSTSLGRMAGRTAGIAALAGAVTILGNELAKATGQKVDLSNFDRDLQAVANGTNTQNLNELVSAFDSLEGVGGKAGKAVEPVIELATAFGLFGNTYRDNNFETIETWNQALAQMVESGNAEQAEVLVKKIAAVMNGFSADTSVSPKLLDETISKFGAYETALDNAAAGSEETAGATDSLTSSTLSAADAQAAQKQALNEATQAMRDKTSATLGAFDAETAYRQAVKAATEAGKNNSAGIKGNSDAALENRGALSQLAGAWNNQSSAVKNSRARFQEARGTFIETATAMGVPQKAAEALARELLEIPRSTLTKTTVETGQAMAAVSSVKSFLDSIPSTVNSRVVVTTTTVNGGRSTGGGITRASGGYVRGPGTTTSDDIPAMLSDKEYVVKAAAVEKYGVGFFDQANAMRLASGGLVGLAKGGQASKSSPRSLDDRLAIAEALKAVRDLERQLRADGKNRIGGLNRKIARLQLDQAEKELKLTRRREAREDRAEAREKLTTRRDALRGLSTGFDLSSIVPDGRPKTVTDEVSAELKEFKDQIVAAGGVWDKSMARYAKGLMAAASELDDVNSAIARETATRDRLVASIDDQQRALDSLNSAMESYADSVASQFKNNPFNQSGDGAPSQALLDAEAALATIRGSATGDSVAAAAEASRLIAQIQELRTAGEGQGAGLLGFRSVLEADIKAAEDMAKALEILRAKGLDTTGPLGGLYQDLAASGDVTTASGLAALTAAEINDYEQLFATREDRASAVAAQATQAVYGAQQRALTDALSASQATLTAVDSRIATLNAQADQIGAYIRNVGAESGRAVQPQLDAINKSIKDIARQQSETKRKGKKN